MAISDLGIFLDIHFALEKHSNIEVDLVSKMVDSAQIL